MPTANKYKVDLDKLFVRMTFMSLALGFLAPGLYVLAAYFMDQGERSKPYTDDVYQLMFWGFLGLSIIEMVVARFVRTHLNKKPGIFSEATFVDDFTKYMNTLNIITLTFVESIAIYGLVQFFLGADIKVVMIFSLVAVIAFQLLRPRMGMLEEALAIQEEHVSMGRFAQPRKR